MERSERARERREEGGVRGVVGAGAEGRGWAAAEKNRGQWVRGRRQGGRDRWDKRENWRMGTVSRGSDILCGILYVFGCGG